MFKFFIAAKEPAIVSRILSPAAAALALAAAVLALNLHESSALKLPSTSTRMSHQPLSFHLLQSV